MYASMKWVINSSGNGSVAKYILGNKLWIKTNKIKLDIIIVLCSENIWKFQQKNVRNFVLALTHQYGPLIRYVQLRVTHAPGMPGAVSPPPASEEIASELPRHVSRHVRHARAVMHVGIVNARWWGKHSRHSRRMRNPQFYISGKKPMNPIKPLETGYITEYHRKSLAA